jgi:hypothetical protein
VGSSAHAATTVAATTRESRFIGASRKWVGVSGPLDSIAMIRWRGVIRRRKNADRDEEVPESCELSSKHHRARRRHVS